MTRTQKTVFILVALIALILGLTINKVLTGKKPGRPDGTDRCGDHPVAPKP